MWRVYKIEVNKKKLCVFKSIILAFIELKKYEDYIFLIHPSLSILDRVRRIYRIRIFFNNNEVTDDYWKLFIFPEKYKSSEIKAEIEVKYIFSLKRKRRVGLRDTFHIIIRLIDNLSERRSSNDISIVFIIKKVKGLGETSTHDILYILQKFFLKNLRRFC